MVANHLRATNGLPPESHEFLTGDPCEVLGRMAAIIANIGPSVSLFADFGSGTCESFVDAFDREK